MTGRLSVLNHGLGVVPNFDSHIRDLRQVFRTGEYVWLGENATLDAITVAADQLYAHPIVIPRTMTFDRITIDLKVGAAGAARLGIYRDGTNHYPGALLLDAGTVDTTSAAVVAVTISQQLTKGLYWLASVFNAGPAPYSVKGQYESGSICGGLLGITATDFTSGYGGWIRAFTYAALPDPFTASGTQRVDVPAIFLRLLSLD